MVAGLEVAIVLRAKKGPALLTQTRGVDVKAAVDASWEVADCLAGHASRTKNGITKGDDGSGDNPPGYSCGDMPAGNERFRVVYRLVSQVYVMAVAPTWMNIFFSTQLVNSIVHQLCTINRGVNLTPEKLTNRFPEVYLAVSALLANGGQVKPAAVAAEAAVDSISSEATKAVKQLRRSVTNPLAMLRGGEKKPLPEAAPLYIAPRSLAEELDPLTEGSFRLPEDALPPLAYVAPEKPSAAPAAGWDMAGYRLLTLSPTASEAEEAETKAAQELGPDQPIGGDMWTSFPEGPRPEAPPIDQLDFPETPSGPRGLWLEEIWRCHVVGRDIKKAGTLGQVLGTVPLTKEHLKTTFRLRQPFNAPVLVEKALKAAQPDLSITVRTEDWFDSGRHVAAFDATFGKPKPVFLQYRLPAVVLPPPIQVRFFAVLSQPEEEETLPSVSTGAVDAAAEAKVTAVDNTAGAEAEGAAGGTAAADNMETVGGNGTADDMIAADGVQASDVDDAAHAADGKPSSIGKETAAAKEMAASKKPKQQRRRLTLVLRYVVNPASLVPLYAVTVDLDLHPHLGQPLKVAPAGLWAAKQQRLQWRLPPLAPGAEGDCKAYFEPDASADTLPVARGGLTASAVEEAVCRIRFTGPPRTTLSGAALEAGLDADSLELVPEQNFFGELTAQAELVNL